MFTGSWPWSAAAENTFLPQEIAALSRGFDRVVVVPVLVRGTRAAVAQENVSVDVSYAAFRTSPMRRAVAALRGAVDPALWSEIRSHAEMLARRPVGIVRTIRAYVDARLAERWAATRVADWRGAVMYTWWFEGTTLGLARFGNRNGVPVFTRAHGRDVYEWRHDPPLLPLRAASMAEVRAVFSASRSGARHIAERYPEHAAKVRPGLLGIEDPGVTNAPSADGVFRLVSCSTFVAVKRVDLMARGIAEAGRANPRQRFEWIHVGIGPLRDAVDALARSIMPENVTYRLVPYEGPAQLYELYRAQPLDVFLNTSESEGTPVAIMEALAVGLPVIATAVGGNPEIVGTDNGVLVSANPEPAELARAITGLLADPACRAAMRRASRAKWAAEYAAETNYQRFVEIIRSS